MSLSTFGTILGIAGIEHGIGEMKQGSVVVGANFLQSWPNNEHYEILAGEPAFSVFPGITYLFLGALAIFVSILLIICSVYLIDKKYGTILFLILNTCMFMFGAGFAGPIIIGIPIILFSLTLRKPIARKQRNEFLLRFIRVSFVTVYAISIISWFMMWPGFVILSYIYRFGDGSENLVYIVGGISMISFFATNIMSIIHDNTNWAKSELI